MSLQNNIAEQTGTYVLTMKERAVAEYKNELAAKVREMIDTDTPTEWESGSEFSTPRIIRASGRNTALDQVLKILES